MPELGFSTAILSLSMGEFGSVRLSWHTFGAQKEVGPAQLKSQQLILI
jgi:hypothetical protein